MTVNFLNIFIQLSYIFSSHSFYQNDIFKEKEKNLELNFSVKIDAQNPHEKK